MTYEVISHSDNMAKNRSEPITAESLCAGHVFVVGLWLYACSPIKERMTYVSNLTIIYSPKSGSQLRQ